MNEIVAPEYKSRKRLRSEKAAVRYLDEYLDLPHGRRQKARGRIRSSLRPLVEAKKIIREVFIGAGSDSDPDFSDVQELRVRLIHRDHMLCQEQVSWLKKLDRSIAANSLSRAAFKQEAAELLSMPNSLPLQHRKDELVFSQQSGRPDTSASFAA
ncbi:hypothetical protein [Mesorhizobium retamae]|uniref:CHAD domain-containing protein n=1 Tax=Mesorhizobium retamae TaxID=2912854 RepID=A0ABS9QCY7_9HYPH|nr:hypothetical protein [Mesorhizobium sp. IRAMC:0171]MCG7504763.1 hypothetical protein [Mesorhizobium sp. IRAMC:0171]